MKLTFYLALKCFRFITSTNEEWTCMVLPIQALIDKENGQRCSLHTEIMAVLFLCPPYVPTNDSTNPQILADVNLSNPKYTLNAGNLS